MKKFFSKIFLLSILFISANVFALETPWQDSSSVKKEGSIQLISAGYTDVPGQIVSGIHMKFTDNWHTYWKFPGDSGLAVTPDFSASQNIAASVMYWPVPERDIFFDVESWAYKKEIILPVESQVIDATKPAKLVVNVKWAICDENCIFVENKMALDIPAGQKDAVTLAAIDEYILKIPEAIAQSGIKLTSLVVTDKSVMAGFSSDKEFADDIDLFIIEASKNFRFPKPVVVRSADGMNISIQTNYEVLQKGETLKDKTLNLTLRNGNAGVEVDFPVKEISVIKETTPDIQVTNSNPQITLLQAILAALIGGLILNIMPCVLPVIMLKIFGVIKHGSSDKKFIRKSFSYTVLGIITSFLLIAVFVVVLKSLGHTIGWGIQFQQQEFLIFLSLVLTLFAANQFGWLDVALPTGIANKINDKLDLAGESTRLGNFLTGAFATLMATPCSAPYLATAISFSFAADALTIFIIFFFMGIGLAIPYLLIMFSPSLVKIFPKPGRWMNVIRVVLGILLFLTNFWIFWIFLNNGGPNSGFMLLVCNILMMIWLFLSHHMKLDRTKTLFTIIWMIFVTFAVSLYLASIEKEPEEMKGSWESFDRQAIDKYVADGKVVFVDVTAEWCLTCKFNKANVIYPMKAYFDKEGIIMMKADYTVPNKPVSDYLAEYDAYGIPMDIIYGPGSRSGIKLPVLLKEQDVKNAVEKVKKK